MVKLVYGEKIQCTTGNADIHKGSILTVLTNPDWDEDGWVVAKAFSVSLWVESKDGLITGCDKRNGVLEFLKLPDVTMRSRNAAAINY